MRDEIPVTEQEEAAWREMERRQQQAARPAAPPSAGQVLTDEEIAACYSAARPAGARRSGTTYAICRAVEAAVLAKLQPPSGQSAAPMDAVFRDAIAHGVGAYIEIDGRQIHIPVEVLRGEQPAAATPDFSTLGAALRAIQQSINLLDAPDHPDKLGAVRRVLRGAVVIAEDAAATVPADEREAFVAWLAREMPAGTVIGDPAWWAPRILRAALAAPAAPYSMPDAPFQAGAEVMTWLRENGAPYRITHRMSHCLYGVDPDAPKTAAPAAQAAPQAGEDARPVALGAGQEHIRALADELLRPNPNIHTLREAAKFLQDCYLATPQPAAQAMPDAWQDIATAPKDGRTLLLGYLNSHGKWRAVRGKWMSEEYIAENWEDPDDVEPGWFETSAEADDPPNCWRIKPTYWMPLPGAPAGLATKGGAA